MKKIFSIALTLLIALMVSVSVASCKKNPQKLAAERLQKSVAGLTFRRS